MPETEGELGRERGRERVKASGGERESTREGRAGVRERKREGDL